MLGYILIVIGFLLIVAECIIPGFGPLVIGGLISLFFGSWLVQGDIVGAAILCLIIFLIAVAAGVIILKLLIKLKVWDAIKLDSSSQSCEVRCNSKAGDEGVALTALRPIGLARFGEHKLHVQSDGQFIEAGALLRIDKIEADRITVSEIHDD